MARQKRRTSQRRQEFQQREIVLTRRSDCRNLRQTTPPARVRARAHYRFTEKAAGLEEHAYREMMSKQHRDTRSGSREQEEVCVKTQLMPQ